VRNYELVYVIRPDLNQEEMGTVRSEVRGHVESMSGTVEKEDSWGKRQLAFEVKDFTEGVYNVLQLKLPPETPAKLKEQLKIDERIIRYMLTLVDRKRKS
jgi:small subunit ribosomal protein S6